MRRIMSARQLPGAFCKVVMGCLGLVFVSTMALADDRSGAGAPAESLESALDRACRDAGLQIIYNADLVHGVVTNGAPRGISIQDTLRRLLAGTGLTFEFVSRSMITITR